MPTFSDETLSILAVIGVGLGGLALLVALAVAARRRAPRAPAGPIQLDEALAAILQGHASKIERLERAARSLHATGQRQQAQLEGTVQRIALVRFDAFEDVGGRLSFACALLDGHGTGAVLTSINGRQETRVYAKSVTQGQSSYNLSLEEEEAIRQAMGSDSEVVNA